MLGEVTRPDLPLRRIVGAAEWKMGQTQGAAHLGQVKWQGFELRQYRGVGEVFL